jgi:hypothetical protein
MSAENRATLIFILWLFSALVLGALFISAGMQGELTGAHTAIAFTIIAAAIIGTPFLLRTTVNEAGSEKAKQHRIDTVLRDLSEDEVAELRKRLIDSESDEEALRTALGDDGELIRRR